MAKKKKSWRVSNLPNLWVLFFLLIFPVIIYFAGNRQANIGNLRSSAYGTNPTPTPRLILGEGDYCEPNISTTYWYSCFNCPTHDTVIGENRCSLEDESYPLPNLDPGECCVLDSATYHWNNCSHCPHGSSSDTLSCGNLGNKCLVVPNTPTRTPIPTRTPTRTPTRAPTSPPTACWTSDTTYRNTTIPAQTGTFTLQFDATPSTNTIDSADIGLSNGTVSSLAGVVASVRFGSVGNIRAYNGATGAYVGTVAYAAGVRYHFRFVVNVTTDKYDVFVTPAGQTERLLASALSFKTAVPQLNNRVVHVNSTSGGTVSVCNFSL